MLNALKDRVEHLKNRSIVKEFSWHTFSAVITQVFAFISIIFVSRYLGPTNLGLFAFVQNYLAIFITMLGAMDFYFTWHIAKSHNHIRDVFVYLIQKTQIAALLFIFGTLLGFIFLPKDVFVLSVILFAPLLLNGLSAFITYALSQRMAKIVSISQSVIAILFFISKLFLIYIKAPLMYFVFIQGVDMVAGSILISIYFLYFKKWSHNKNEIKNIWIETKIVNTFKLLLDIRYNFVLVVFWQLVMRVDQLILAKFTSAYTLGIYSAAVKLAEAPNAIVTVLGLVAYPRVVNYVQTKTTYADNQIKKFMYLYLGIGILFSISIFIFAKLIISILYGVKFEESVNILMIYAFSVPGLFLSYYYMIVFGAMEERKWPAVIAVLSVIINILFVIIFTKHLGIVGTALASAISYSISGFIFHFAYKIYKRKVNLKLS